jgi:FeoB-associated Cys-rich membrane protein
MIQQILIGLIFLGAAFYLGRMVYRSFQAKNACTSGCGKCGAADLEEVQKAAR